MVTISPLVQKALATKGIVSPQTLLGSIYLVPPVVTTPVPVAPTISPVPPPPGVPKSPPPVITYSPSPQPKPTPPLYSPPTNTYTSSDDNVFEDDWYNTPSYSSTSRNNIRVQNNYNTLEYDRPQYRVAPPRPAAPYASRPVPAYNMGCPNRMTPQNNCSQPSFSSFQTLLPLLASLFSNQRQLALPSCPPYGFQQPSGPIFNFNFNFGSNHNFLASPTGAPLFNWL